jgi:hypothetical protein
MWSVTYFVDYMRRVVLNADESCRKAMRSGAKMTMSNPTYGSRKTYFLGSVHSLPIYIGNALRLPKIF